MISMWHWLKTTGNCCWPTPNSTNTRKIKRWSTKASQTPLSSACAKARSLCRRVVHTLPRWNRCPCLARLVGCCVCLVCFEHNTLVRFRFWARMWRRRVSKRLKKTLNCGFWIWNLWNKCLQWVTNKFYFKIKNQF